MQNKPVSRIIASGLWEPCRRPKVRKLDFFGQLIFKNSKGLNFLLPVILNCYRWPRFISNDIWKEDWT